MTDVFHVAVACGLDLCMCACMYASAPSRMFAGGISGSKFQEPNRHYYS